MMVKWYKNKQNLNISDIMKIIDILPCCWADGYADYDTNDKLIPTPKVDGNNLIYATSDCSDGWVVRYYKCSADGTILAIGEDRYKDEEEEETE